MTDWMLADLAELFSETVSIEPYSSGDGYGAESYGAAVERNCHIEGRSRIVRTAPGIERVSTVQVYLDGAYGTTEKDRLTLPARFDPRTTPIMAVERFADESGSHSEVIYL